MSVTSAPPPRLSNLARNECGPMNQNTESDDENMDHKHVDSAQEKTGGAASYRQDREDREGEEVVVIQDAGEALHKRKHTLSGYQLFLKEHRAAFKRTNRGAGSGGELIARLAKLWLAAQEKVKRSKDPRSFTISDP